MTLAKEIARFIEISSVFEARRAFKWASGIKSPIYTDNRVTLVYPETLHLIEDGFVKEISGGISRCSCWNWWQQALSWSGWLQIRWTPHFLPISAAKPRHWAGTNEGRCKKLDQKMVVIEDLISTGTGLGCYRCSETWKCDDYSGHLLLMRAAKVKRTLMKRVWN